jgi:4'-phosphopantetheinyl transferase
MNKNNQTLECAQQKPIYWEEVTSPNEVAKSKEFSEGYELHVWQCCTNESYEVISNIYPHLSSEEKTKANRFRFSHDQNRYVVAHGLLRIILGAYVEREPAELIIERTNTGKPNLVTSEEVSTIQFYMTHSEDIVCYIISKVSEVGIDIEFINPNFDWYSIAKLYFTTPEMSLLESLPDDEQVKTFFTLWTRKEAFLKVTGKGLSGLTDMENSTINSIKNKISLFPFQYGEDYQGTFAVNNKTPKIRFFSFSTSKKWGKYQGQGSGD